MMYESYVMQKGNSVTEIIVNNMFNLDGHCKRNSSRAFMLSEIMSKTTTLKYLNF